VPRLPRFALYNSLNAWGKQRELPEFPKQSFREQFRQRKKGIHHGDPEGPEKKQEN
jgi:L-lactate dehydrogenase complex protein LldF